MMLAVTVIIAVVLAVFIRQRLLERSAAREGVDRLADWFNRHGL